MKREEKELLLKDLCAREPYHPRISVFNDGYEGFQNGEFDTNLWLHHIDAFRFDRIEIWPYLRPMSNMTDEEAEEYNDLVNELSEYDYQPEQSASKIIDWLNAHHFDYRGLIPMGLALEAKEGMYAQT